jgi:hypothetical protein
MLGLECEAPAWLVEAVEWEGLIGHLEGTTRVGAAEPERPTRSSRSTSVAWSTRSSCCPQVVASFEWFSSPERERRFEGLWVACVVAIRGEDLVEVIEVKPDLCAVEAA